MWGSRKKVCTLHFFARAGVRSPSHPGGPHSSMDAPPAFRPASARPDSALTAGGSEGGGGGGAPIWTEDIERLDFVCAALARPSSLAACAGGAARGGGADVGGSAGVKVALLRVSFGL